MKKLILNDEPKSGLDHTVCRLITSSLLLIASLQIPQGTTSAIATSTTPKIAGDRFCGTFFDAALAGDATDSDTICTREYPFRISVNFDQDEVCTAAAAGTCENLAAANTAHGFLGFSLYAYQVAC